MKKLLSFSLLLGLIVSAGGFAYAADGAGPSSPTPTTAPTDGTARYDVGADASRDYWRDGKFGLNGYTLQNSPNNPATNYPGDYWDSLRSLSTNETTTKTDLGNLRDNARPYTSYAAADGTATGYRWGWLGLLGLIGLAGRLRNRRTVRS